MLKPDADGMVVGADGRSHGDSVTEVTIFTESRYHVDREGRVRESSGTLAGTRWTRYLEFFDRVRVVARVASRARTESFEARAPVSFLAIPYYVGPWRFLQRLPAVRGAVRAACDAESAFILRAPGRLATLAGSELRRAGRPYGVEVLGDPRDVFASGSIDHRLRPLFRYVFQADLRRLTLHAAAAAYVTDAALQRRYPCPAFEIGVSDVEIGEDALADTSRRARPGPDPFRIVTVGSLDTLCKGPDVLLDALARCAARGLDVCATFVGDGRHRPELEARASALGLAERIRFRGEVPAGAAVRAELDAADLFVLPSRAEGLPRALIEAMARGLPCLASSVGGIPELLGEDALVPAGDAGALALRIEALRHRPHELDRMAAQNLARASDFREPLLVDRRLRFYREVLRRTVRDRRLQNI